VSEKLCDFARFQLTIKAFSIGKKAKGIDFHNGFGTGGVPSLHHHRKQQEIETQILFTSPHHPITDTESNSCGEAGLNPDHQDEFDADIVSYHSDFRKEQTLAFSSCLHQSS
jgi:hypothetical protein